MKILDRRLYFVPYTAYAAQIGARLWLSASHSDRRAYHFILKTCLSFWFNHGGRNISCPTNYQAYITYTCCSNYLKLVNFYHNQCRYILVFYFLVVILLCSVDPFTKKEWYDVKAPAMFNVRNIGKTLCSRTQGTSEFLYCFLKFKKKLKSSCRLKIKSLNYTQSAEYKYNECVHSNVIVDYNQL